MDIIGVEVVRFIIIEIIVFGVVYLVGFVVGFWEFKEEIVKKWVVSEVYVLSLDEDKK